MTLDVSNTALEGIYQGSKYLKIQVLCDGDELAQLFEVLNPFWIYPLTGLVDGEAVGEERFLREYCFWIEKLKEGCAPTERELRSVLACAFTAETGALWKQEVPGNRYLIKMRRPVIQVQAHFFSYSPLDEVFRPMTMGAGSIFWGLQLSYPQIYQEPKTMEFFESDESPNRELFQKVKQWSRDVTRATPFVVGEKRTNVPLRLGKGCFSWIHRYPQLLEQGIRVYAD